MPSKHPDTALRDILHHIDLAERFVDGIDRELFLDEAGVEIDESPVPSEGGWQGGSEQRATEPSASAGDVALAIVRSTKDPKRSLVVTASCGAAKPLHTTICNTYLRPIAGMPIRPRQS